MRKFTVLILSALLCWSPIVFIAGCSGGCATTQRAFAYKTLNIVATSVDAGMKAFADAVVAGKVTADVQAKVKDLHGRYQKALQGAIVAARFDMSQPTPENVQALATELLNVITEIARG